MGCSRQLGELRTCSLTPLLSLPAAPHTPRPNVCMYNTRTHKCTHMHTPHTQHRKGGLGLFLPIPRTDGFYDPPHIPSPPAEGWDQAPQG